MNADGAAGSAGHINKRGMQKVLESNGKLAEELHRHNAKLKDQTRRIHELETAAETRNLDERIVKENERLTKENERLCAENERLAAALK